MRESKKRLQKALFLSVIVLLVAALAISPAASAPKAPYHESSDAQRLITAAGPHTYIDFKSCWGNDAQIAATLAKYDVVALHCIETPQHIQEIKAINPHTVVLAYFNPLFGGQEGRPHAEWYLRDASGNTHPSGYPNEPLMDLTKPGWQAMCVEICKKTLAKGFDGLVLDNGLSSPNILYPGSWPGSDSQWESSTIQLFQNIKQVAGDKIVIYNGAYFIPGYVGALDGWMDEGFPFYKGWDNSIGFALDASTKGKLTLFYAQGGAADRYFVYCSALLTDGYFFYAPTGKTPMGGPSWFDDYGMHLGTALGKAHKSSDGTWQRDYQYGTVVVNPNTKTARIDMKSGQNARWQGSPVAPKPTVWYRTPWTPKPTVKPKPTPFYKPITTPAPKPTVKPKPTPFNSFVYKPKTFVYKPKTPVRAYTVLAPKTSPAKTAAFTQVKAAAIQIDKPHAPIRNPTTKTKPVFFNKAASKPHLATSPILKASAASVVKTVNNPKTQKPSSIALAAKISPTHAPMVATPIKAAAAPQPPMRTAATPSPRKTPEETLKLEPQVVPAAASSEKTKGSMPAPAQASPPQSLGASRGTPISAASIPVATPTNTYASTAPAALASSSSPNNAASLPPQPVIEFSLLGLGLPAVAAGMIYLFIRK